MSDPMWINAGRGDLVGNGAMATSGLVTLAAHGLVEGQPIMLDNRTGGAVPAFELNTVYYVTDPELDPNEFFIAYAPGGPLVTLGSAGTMDVYTAVPHYNAAELRRADAGSLFGGVAGAFDARSGVRPGYTPVTLSGTTWTVEDLTGVVSEINATSGPYRVQHSEESGSLNPADGTNDRIDALDLQIQDDDEDASGFRRARVVYTPGSPGAGVPPDQETNAPNSVRLTPGGILVPSGGTPSPSIIEPLAQFTVASGGVLPVRDSSELPTLGLYDGMAAFDQSQGALVVRSGGAWPAIGLADPPMIRTFLNATGAHDADEDVFGTMVVDFAYPDAGVWDSGVHSAVKEIPRDGVYRVTAMGRTSSIGSADGIRQVTLRKNPVGADPSTGTILSSAINQPDDTPDVSAFVSILHPFTAGDLIVAGFLHTSAGTVNLSGGGVDRSFFEVEWVRPL